MDKRKFGRLAAATTATALYGGAVAAAYKEQGADPAPNDAAKMKRVAAAAVLLTGLAWLTATL